MLKLLSQWINDDILAHLRQAENLIQYIILSGAATIENLHTYIKILDVFCLMLNISKILFNDLY